MLIPVVLLSLNPLHGVFPGILPSTCSTGLLTSSESGNVQLLVNVLEGYVGIVVDDEKAIFRKLYDAQGFTQEANCDGKFNGLLWSLVG